MTNMMVRRTTRSAPVPEKAFATLLDTVNVVSGNDLLDASGLYTSLNCLVTDTVTSMCPDARGTKTFGTVSVVNGIKFPVYTGVTCRQIGGDWENLPKDLKRVQNNKESQAVEKALMQLAFTGAATGTTQATDLTPAGGAVTPRQGLAILEGHARHFYAGVPTIHLPVTIGAQLFVDQIREGSRIFSALGSKLVMGSGYEYPNNGPVIATAVPAGELWIYATGEVTVERGPYREVPPQMNRATNETFALVETFYVADVDCYTSAVRVKIA